MRGLLSLYAWRYPVRLMSLWERHPRAWAFYKAFWRTKDFAYLDADRSDVGSQNNLLIRVLYAGSSVQIVAGATLITLGLVNDLVGGWQFGVATILSYPIVWAHLVPALIGVWWLAHPKALGRSLVCCILESQVRRLRKRHSITVVAVAGSVGKTSTKIAIARVLQASRRVVWQEGNYNDRVTVPLIFFEQTEPGLFNVVAWLKIFIQNEQRIRQGYPYQIAVVELGTDAPGHIGRFAYLKPELVVITAVTPEHMEYFGDMDAVAREELSALHFARQALVNTDDTPVHYLEDRHYFSYGLEQGATYTATERRSKGLQGQEITLRLGAHDSFTLQVPLLGIHGAKVAIAAAAVAHLLGLPLDDIQRGVAAVSAFAGRMQVLPGVLGSTLIDDTYNSSPIAAKAALDVLQSGMAPQRIAILGSMNELGAYSPEAHREVGAHCDPTKLDWVITVGADAKTYLAPVAAENGCRVKAFMDPYKAGRFVKKQLKEGAVVLAKGSQNRVFTEETLKLLLADPEDAAKLVRQSAYWMGIKQKQFPT